MVTQVDQSNLNGYKNVHFPTNMHLIIKFEEKHCAKHAMTPIGNLYLEELLETTPETVNVTPRPYDSLCTPESQVLITYRLLQRSARRKDRIMTLLYAYYLGEIIENTIHRPHQRYLNSQVSKYYSITSRRLYNLFEKSGVEQILRTKKITLIMVSKLKFTDYQFLIGQ